MDNLIINNNSRSLVLDTETTGFRSQGDDRIVEIGIREIIDRKLTDNIFHVYVDPRRDVPEEAYAVHGLSRDDLVRLSKGKGFEDIADDMLEFIGDSPIIAHNAGFDMGFLDAELKRCSMKTYAQRGNEVIDTLLLANIKYPGQANNLDALCRRLIGANNFSRELHGALLDATLLADVYRIMTIEQEGMQFESKTVITRSLLKPERLSIPSGSLHLTTVSAEDKQANEKMRQRIEKTSGGKYPSFDFGM